MPFSNIWNIRKLFIMVGRHIMVLWWGHAPRFLCYQLQLGAHFFMRDRSYQCLKDATSFGLLSDKSAEKLKGENLNFCQNGRIGNFCLHGHGLYWLRVTSHACTKAIFEQNSVSARQRVWRISNFFNIWT